MDREGVSFLKNREQYLAKRAELLASSFHLVEIDLLRGGPRMPMTNMPECDYCVLVRRMNTRPDAGVWPIRLHEPLRSVPIPLRAPHADAQLDLQALLHRIYDAAGYEDYIYSGQPRPPPSAEDASSSTQRQQACAVASSTQRKQVCAVASGTQRKQV